VGAVSSRRIDTVILCEGDQDEVFLRRLIEKVSPSGQKPRVLKSPKARGSGESFVVRRFPEELKALRTATAHRSARLIVMVDGDGGTHQSRRERIESECITVGVEPPAADEPVLVLVPCRNIETWIAYLGGQTVNETDTYTRLQDKKKGCASQVTDLAEMCRLRQLRSPAPPALEAACRSYRKLPPRR
jgi:hypothetical protein